MTSKCFIVENGLYLPPFSTCICLMEWTADPKENMIKA